MEVKCVIAGCLELFKTEEPVSPQVRFICKNHPRQAQLNAIGRVFKPKRDDRDQDVHFQSVQFDSGLVRKGRSPKIDSAEDSIIDD